MLRGLIQRIKMTCSARMEAVVVKKVRVTEAKEHLSALMARAGYAGERYLIERRGKPLAALVGVEDLKRLEAEGESPRWRPRGTLSLDVCCVVEKVRKMTFLNCRYRLQEAQICRGKWYTVE